jgi:hypothetical protein
MNWRKQLFEGTLRIFEVRRPDISEKFQEGRFLEIRLSEKDGVIAELAKEVLELKKSLWLGKRKKSLERRQLIECELNHLANKTGITHIVLARYAGVAERTWREWLRRKGQEKRHNEKSREHWLTPDEERVCEHWQERLERGYRVLCWEMVDLEERKKGFDWSRYMNNGILTFPTFVLAVCFTISSVS